MTDAHDHAPGAHFHPEVMNPALDATRFCPRCGATPRIEYPRSMHCDTCGYAQFYNPKPVAGAIPREPDGRIWLLRRGFDPGAGLWTFPGGFVDLGESVDMAARREAREELEIEIELSRLVGVYSRSEDRVVLVVYEARFEGEPRPTAEAPEVRAFAPGEIPWDELAFWSTERALRDLLAGDGASGAASG
jgi:ADP-ribose pyrophosphatase YjhB (NUDIX family)